MVKLVKNMKREMLVYLCMIALSALGLALSHNVFSNYFKDVYNVSAYQRGLIEFPREIPGFLSILVVGALSFISDIKISMIAQLLSIVGIAALGFMTPPFGVMLIFIFINSMGMHLFMPMQTSIGMSLIKDGRIGKRMGQYRGVTTAFRMFGAIIVFVGFKFGLLSFDTPVKYVFIISAAIFAVVFVLLIYLDKLMKHSDLHHKKQKYVFRKEYKYYYILVVMFGVQKQMMMVYAPWVLIDLLSKKVETLAILAIVGSFIGIFFIPAVGRWLDIFGVKKLLYIDALSFIGVYALFGILCAGYVDGFLAKAGLPVLLAYILFIVDRMSTQLGLVRTVYLKSIAVETTDITPTLSLGMTMDHFVSITAAFLGGIVWTQWGPQYIFFLVSGLSLVNLYVAIKVKD